jgi:hypothetical protein
MALLSSTRLSTGAWTPLSLVPLYVAPDSFYGAKGNVNSSKVGIQGIRLGDAPHNYVQVSIVSCQHDNLIPQVSTISIQAAMSRQECRPIVTSLRLVSLSL